MKNNKADEVFKLIRTGYDLQPTGQDPAAAWMRAARRGFKTHVLPTKKEDRKTETEPEAEEPEKNVEQAHETPAQIHDSEEVEREERQAHQGPEQEAQRETVKPDSWAARASSTTKEGPVQETPVLPVHGAQKVLRAPGAQKVLRAPGAQEKPGNKTMSRKKQRELGYIEDACADIEIEYTDTDVGIEYGGADIEEHTGALDAPPVPLYPRKSRGPSGPEGYVDFKSFKQLFLGNKKVNLYANFVKTLHAHIRVLTNLVADNGQWGHSNNKAFSVPAIGSDMERVHPTAALKYSEWMHKIDGRCGVKITSVRSMIFDNILRKAVGTDKIRQIFASNEDIRSKTPVRICRYVCDGEKDCFNVELENIGQYDFKEATKEMHIGTTYTRTTDAATFCKLPQELPDDGNFNRVMSDWRRDIRKQYKDAEYKDLNKYIAKFPDFKKFTTLNFKIYDRECIKMKLDDGTSVSIPLDPVLVFDSYELDYNNEFHKVSVHDNGKKYVWNFKTGSWEVKRETWLPRRIAKIVQSAGDLHKALISGDTVPAARSLLDICKQLRHANNTDIQEKLQQFCGHDRKYDVKSGDLHAECTQLQEFANGRSQKIEVELGLTKDETWPDIQGQMKFLLRMKHPCLVIIFSEVLNRMRGLPSQDPVARLKGIFGAKRAEEKIEIDYPDVTVSLNFRFNCQVSDLTRGHKSGNNMTAIRTALVKMTGVPPVKVLNISYEDKPVDTVLSDGQTIHRNYTRVTCKIMMPTNHRYVTTTDKPVLEGTKKTTEKAILEGTELVRYKKNGGRWEYSDLHWGILGVIPPRTCARVEVIMSLILPLSMTDFSNEEQETLKSNLASVVPGATVKLENISEYSQKRVKMNVIMEMDDEMANSAKKKLSREEIIRICNGIISKKPTIMVTTIDPEYVNILTHYRELAKECLSGQITDKPSTKPQTGATHFLARLSRSYITTIEKYSLNSYFNRRGRVDNLYKPAYTQVTLERIKVKEDGEFGANTTNFLNFMIFDYTTAVLKLSDKKRSDHQTGLRLGKADALVEQCLSLQLQTSGEIRQLEDNNKHMGKSLREILTKQYEHNKHNNSFLSDISNESDIFDFLQQQWLLHWNEMIVVHLNDDSNACKFNRWQTHVTNFLDKLGDKHMEAQCNALYLYIDRTRIQRMVRTVKALKLEEVNMLDSTAWFVGTTNNYMSNLMEPSYFGPISTIVSASVSETPPNNVDSGILRLQTRIINVSLAAAEMTTKSAFHVNDGGRIKKCVRRRMDVGEMKLAAGFAQHVDLWLHLILTTMHVQLYFLCSAEKGVECIPPSAVVLEKYLDTLTSHYFQKWQGSTNTILDTIKNRLHRSNFTQENLTQLIKKLDAYETFIKENEPTSANIASSDLGTAITNLLDKNKVILRRDLMDAFKIIMHLYVYPKYSDAGRKMRIENVFHAATNNVSGYDLESANDLFSKSQDAIVYGHMKYIREICELWYAIPEFTTADNFEYKQLHVLKLMYMSGGTNACHKNRIF
jgi:hypothetical protein